MFLGGRSFNILTQIFLFQWNENKFISLVLKPKQQKTIQLPYIFFRFYDSIIQSIFVIFSFFWFMKFKFIHLESSFYVIP